VSDLTTYALLSTAAATSFLHTLIPDHWLPFVLIGRSRRWTTATVVLVSGLSGLIHTLLSIVLGVATLAIGLSAAEAVGETLHHVAGPLLVVFGLAYAYWARRKGGHFHPGGALLHRGMSGGACGGEEGDTHPEHLHYHADDEMIAGRAGWSGLALAVVVGLNPCVLVLPILLASVPRGMKTMGLVILAYSLPAVALMVGLSVLGVRLGWKIKLPWLARNAEPASGLLIAVLGVIFWLVEG